MRECPRCGRPLVREVIGGKERERCTRCPYHAWIVPKERTKATPKLGGWGVVLTPTDDVGEKA